MSNETEAAILRAIARQEPPSPALHHAVLMTYLVDRPPLTIDELARNLQWPRARVNDILAELLGHGLIVCTRGRERFRTVVRYALRTPTPETAP